MLSVFEAWVVVELMSAFQGEVTHRIIFDVYIAWYALEGSTLALWKTTKESAQKQQYCENFPPTFFPFCSQWSFVLLFIDMF